jgi:hypothetical protein
MGSPSGPWLGGRLTTVERCLRNVTKDAKHRQFFALRSMQQVTGFKEAEKSNGKNFVIMSLLTS